MNGDVRKYLPKQDIAPRPQRGKKEYPSISNEQWHQMLDSRTGRDGFIDFEGNAELFPPKREFISIFRIHDEFPELGELKNFALELRGNSSTAMLAGAKQAKSPKDLNSYGLSALLDRSFGELPSEAPPQALVRRGENAEHNTGAYHSLPRFLLRGDLTPKDKVVTREFLCQLTKQMFAEILKQKPQNPEQLFTLAENFVGSHLEELREKGVKTIYYSNGWQNL